MLEDPLASEAPVASAATEGGSAAGVAAPALMRSRRRGWAGWIVAAFFAVAGIGSTAWLLLQPMPFQDTVRVTIASSEKSPFATNGPGFLALSPDGRRLAFVATTEGKSQLWVRALDSLTPQLLPGTDDAWQPTWSPDGRHVLFTASVGAGQLKEAAVAGGTPVTLSAWANYTAAWSTAGVILFTGHDDRLYRIPESGGQPVPATEFDKSRQEISHVWPIFLSDGRRFIFLARSRDPSRNALYLASLDSPSRTHLVDVTSSVAYSAGHLIYQRDGTLMAQPFDERSGRVIGDAAPMLEGIEYNPNHGRAAFSVSANGTLAYRASGSSSTTTLTWFDRLGRRVGTVGEPGTYLVAQVSRDGRWIAVSKGDAGRIDIWTIDVERKVSTRLTSDPANDHDPVWSADGAHVIFRSIRKAAYDLYQRAVNGAGTDELLFESPETKVPTGVSSDGKLLLFTRHRGNQNTADVWALPLVGERKPFPVIATEFNESNAVFSPDGRWIAYQSDESASQQIYLQPFPTTGARVRLSTTTGSNPAWSGDGKQIYFRTVDNHLLVVDMTSPVRPGVPTELFTQGGTWTIDPAGQRFLIPVSGEAAVAAPITVVLNWAAALGKK